MSRNQAIVPLMLLLSLGCQQSDQIIDSDAESELAECDVDSDSGVSTTQQSWSMSDLGCQYRVSDLISGALLAEGACNSGYVSVRTLEDETVSGVNFSKYPETDGLVEDRSLPLFELACYSWIEDFADVVDLSLPVDDWSILQEHRLHCSVSALPQDPHGSRRGCGGGVEYWIMAESTRALFNLRIDTDSLKPVCSIEDTVRYRAHGHFEASCDATSGRQAATFEVDF